MLKNKKILWMAHEGIISGANICLLEFLTILKDNGFENIVMMPYLGSMANAVNQLGIPALLIKSYSWASPKNNPSKFIGIKKWLRNKIAVNQISKIIKDFEPDYIASNTIVTYIAAKAAKKNKKRHVWFVHEFGEEDHGFTICGKFSRGAKFINELSYKVVFNSKATLKKFQQYVSLSKQLVVSYPIFIQPAKILQPSTTPHHFNIIILGQIAASKNHLEALSALYLCKKQGLRFTFNIVGKAEDFSFFTILKEFISKKNLNNNVSFTGVTLNPSIDLQRNHILLMCSLNEAFGRVTVEALKLGLPVIAANTGGSPELIKDGFNGYLYKKGDVDDLSEKILKLAKNYSNFNSRLISETAETDFNTQNTLSQLCQVFN